MVNFSMNYVNYAMSPEKLRAVCPDLCTQDCKKCLHYDSKMNLCRCASLTLEFPMYEELLSDIADSCPLVDEDGFCKASRLECDKLNGFSCPLD